MTYFELRCNYGFHLYFDTNISYFGFEISLLSTVACKHSDVYYLGYKTIQFLFFSERFY